MSEANDFLMAGGTTSAKFPTVGTTVGGTIVRQPELKPQTDVATGEPKYWSDGKPKQQVVVHVATDLRDPSIDDDDGERAIYVKGNLTKAVREAVRKSGSKGLEVGGHLSVTYVADGEVSQRGFNPPKVYSAAYTPPTAAAANEFIASAPEPTPAPAPVAAPVGVDPAVLAALQQLTPEQRALLNQTGS